MSHVDTQVLFLTKRLFKKIRQKSDQNMHQNARNCRMDLIGSAWLTMHYPKQIVKNVKVI